MSFCYTKLIQTLYTTGKNSQDYYEILQGRFELYKVVFNVFKVDVVTFESIIRPRVHLDIVARKVALTVVFHVVSTTYGHYIHTLILWEAPSETTVQGCHSNIVKILRTFLMYLRLTVQ